MKAVLKEILEPYGDGPRATRASLFFDIFIISCIMASCTLICIDHFASIHIPVFTTLEYIFTGIFIVEYVLRWYVSDNRWTYPFGYMAIIDLLAILPTVLLMNPDLLMLRMIRGIRMLRILRLLRLLRLLKILRYGFIFYRGFQSFKILLSALNEQYRLRQIARLATWTIVSWILGANIVHMTERFYNPDTGPFSTYWKSYWHILIVLISGIEDKEPVSLAGRIEITLMLVIGIILISLLTGEIVSILVRKNEQAGKIQSKPPQAVFSNHIIIIHVNHHLDPIIREIHQGSKGKAFILIISPEVDTLAATDKSIYSRVFGLAGNPLHPRVLLEGGVEHARRVIILSPFSQESTPDDADRQALMAALAVNCKHQNVHTIVELHSSNSLKHASVLDNVEYVVSKKYCEYLISQSIITNYITEIFNDLMTFSQDTSEFYTELTPPSLIGKTYREAQLHFMNMDHEAIILIGLVKSNGDAHDPHFILKYQEFVKKNPDQDYVLKQTDKLVLIAHDTPAFSKEMEAERWKQQRI
jgi:voltage-gated potassium channel